MQNLRSFVVALLLIPALSESAWCQDTGARQPGAAFQQRKANAVNQLNERVSSLQQRLSCVQAANDGNAVRACMQQTDAGGNGGQSAGGAQGGGQFPQFKAQTLQHVQERLTAVQQRLACVQAANAPEALQACPSGNPGQAGADNSHAVASGADNGGPPVSGGNVAAPIVADKGLDTMAARITEHGFPSIFEAWHPVDNLREPNGSTVPLSSKESPLASEARHDLYWGGWQQLGLRLAAGQQYPLLSPVFTPESIQVALRNRATLLAANPDIVILSEVHYHAAQPNFLPPDSPFWVRNADFESKLGKVYGTRLLAMGNPEFQDKLGAFCAALVKSGVYDGCMLDGWHDDDDTPARIGLIRKMRSAVGEKAILLGNVNERLPTRTASYLNGMYMEGLYARFFPDWHLAAANLIWGERNLRKPAITALEGWSAGGLGQLPLMRQVTTLSLVFSNGYVLFSEPNSPSGDHVHDWYPFWNKSLGRPTGPLATLDRPDLSGAYTRKFDKGEVVFNPPSNHPVTVHFDQPHRSAATNATGQSFTVASGDGDLFLTL